MTLSLPPTYVPLPVEVIEQAYAPDRPHRALFASFVRLLSLAWENKYHQTPRLQEEELFNIRTPDGSVRYGFLKLERRQYFQQKREMELLGWLRSSHPATGFVQFTFQRALTLAADASPDAENRTPRAENRTDVRIEEEESLKLLKPESSSSSSTEEPVRKIALGELSDDEQQVEALISSLPLLFDPQEYGLLEVRPAFLKRHPDDVLGWITKAYQDRQALRQRGGAIGLIVARVMAGAYAAAYYVEHAADILPEAYLEAIGRIEYECDDCTTTFTRRTDKQAHEQAAHPFHCLECSAWFLTFEDEQTHYQERHAPDRKAPDPQALPAHAGSGEAGRTWLQVLTLLQADMPRASFETWVRDTQAVRYDGNTLTVAVRNTYAQDWLESRMTATVQRMLVGILHVADVAVVFEVQA